MFKKIPIQKELLCDRVWEFVKSKSDKLKFYVSFVKDTKMTFIGSGNNWVGVDMNYDEEEGAWVVKKDKIVKGRQLLVNKSYIQRRRRILFR